MIGLERKRHNKSGNSDAERIAELKRKINSEEYIYGAISRLAQVVSNEIMGLPQGGTHDGQQQWRERPL